MSKENSKQFGLPEAITKYSEEKVYKFVEPIAAAVDEEWLRKVSVHYPHPYCLRHYWQKIIEMFLEHVVESGGFEAFVSDYGRRLKRPKKGSLEWFIKRIKNRESALRAIEKFIDPSTYLGAKVIFCFDCWLHQDGLIGGDDIDNEDLVDFDNLVEIR